MKTEDFVLKNSIKTFSKQQKTALFGYFVVARPLKKGRPFRPLEGFFGCRNFGAAHGGVALLHNLRNSSSSNWKSGRTEGSESLGGRVGDGYQNLLEMKMFEAKNDGFGRYVSCFVMGDVQVPCLISGEYMLNS